jgi:ketosteroid isomerase-like protein
MRSKGQQLDDIEQLRWMASEFAQGFNSGDVDRIMCFYDKTYVDINLRNPVQSWVERRAYYAHIIERGGFRVTVRPDEIQVHGDFAFVRGTLELIRTDATRTELRYLEIVHRDPNGSWRVMWGMDGPIQEYTPS